MSSTIEGGTVKASSPTTSDNKKSAFPNLLSFHKQILNEALTEPNNLLILAKGLGLDTIIIPQILKLYASHESQQLVFVLNASSHKSGQDYEFLKGLVPQVHSITSADFTQEERKMLYLQGGVFFVTPRILCVDMLTERLPMSLVSGIIVLNAHALTETCAETFILRLYRQTNKTGFVKAFSEEAPEFVKGFSKLEKAMKYLFVHKVFLYPRFQLQVVQCLEKHEPEIVEIEQPLSSRMKIIQDSLIKIIKAVLTEIKENSSNAVDMGEFTLETCLCKEFEHEIKKQLQPIWDKVGVRTRQMIQDLNTLRKLTSFLTKLDCVTFFNYLENIRLSEGHYGIPKSYWMFTDEAQDVFYYAKQRVYTITSTNQEEEKKPSPKKKQKTLTQMVKQEPADDNEEGKKESKQNQPAADDSSNVSLGLTLEANPKWNLLEQILTEIQGEIAKQQNSTVTNKVLILVNDQATCVQLQQILLHGPKNMLSGMMERLVKSYNIKQESYNAPTPQAPPQYFYQKNYAKAASSSGTPSKSKKSTKAASTKTKGGKKRKASVSAPKKAGSKVTPQLELQLLKEKIALKPSQPNTTKKNAVSAPTTQDIITIDDDSQDMVSSLSQTVSHTKAEPSTSTSTSTVTSVGLSEVTIQRKAEGGQTVDLDIMICPLQTAPPTLLDALRPTFVVMYDCHVAFIRRVELFKALNPGIPLRVYFLMYTQSTEHQLYIHSLKTEKEAFESLIQQKARIVIPSMETILSTLEQSSPLKQVKPSTTNSSRKGGSALALRNQNKVKQVIIDTREFRSSLPSMLHQSGINVIPITLSVGDYIITTEFCIERKSPSDLWQSLNSGRLFSQCERMFKYYSKVAVLIEFSDNDPFILVPSSDYGDDINGSLITSKLALLHIHFPQLRLLWSRNPFMSVKIVDMIKSQPAAKEPDPVAAQSMGSGEVDEDNEEEASSNQAIEFLKRLPGVNGENIHNIIANVRNLNELSQMTLEELSDIMGKACGTKLYEFLNTDGPAQLAKMPNK